MLVDSHCHLDYHQRDGDVDDGDDSLFWLMDAGA